MEKKIEFLSLQQDLSAPELKDLEAVRTYVQTDCKLSSKPAARVVALAMIEQAVNSTSARPSTQKFADLANLRNSAFQDVVKAELLRLGMSNIMHIDLGTNYLALAPISGDGRSVYRHNAIRSYFRGEPISPKA